MSGFWLSALSFVVAVVVLVGIHEFGHFWVARRLGFKVLRFSIGFGSPLWKRVGKVDGTEFVLASVPLGGYVKMLDEREGPVAPHEVHRAFNRRPHWQRIAVLLAGPAFNFFFAILVLAGLLMVEGSTEVRPLLGPVVAQSRAAQAGVRAGDEIVSINGRAALSQRDVWVGLLDEVSAAQPISLGLRDPAGQVRIVQLGTGTAAERRALSEPAAVLAGLGLRFKEPDIPAQVGAVQSNGPAARAGLRAGDVVLSVNAEPVHNFRQLVTLVNAHPDETITLRYARAGRENTVRIQTVGELQDGKRVGHIYLVPPREIPWPPEMLRHVNLGIGGAFMGALEESWTTTAFQARMMWRMIAGSVSVKNLGGALTIAELAGDSAAAGVSTFLHFLVMISLALGFLNLLPIPILDGGQIVMQAIEWLKGSPLSERVQAASQQLGIALVLLLVGVALFNDITRQFG
jgi:regulator of sigma E protease